MIKMGNTVMEQLDAKEATIEENNEIGCCLQKFVEDNRISNIEIRIIKDAIQSNEQIATLYKELIAGKDEASKLDILDKIYRNLHLRNDAETADSSESDSDGDHQKNPLLNDLVIECMFGFLPLSDILKCRLVNQKWNKEAESILHKRRAKIHFESAEQCPSKFLTNSFLSNKQNYFNDFTFLPCPQYNGGKWPIAELSQFFSNWGDKVEKLKFQNIVLDMPGSPTQPHGLCYEHAYRITDWISGTPNLTHLDINCEGGTTMRVNHNQLFQIKFLSLIQCILDIGRDSEQIIRKVRPSVLTLKKVIFQIEDSSMELTRLNDFFDLNSATYINLSNNRLCSRPGVFVYIILTMSAQVFQTDMFICGAVIFEDWEHAEGNINYLFLKDIFLKHKTLLKIKQICTRNRGIDLSALPIAVEKMNVPLSGFIMRSDDEVELPNLTSLHFVVNDQSQDLEALNHFLDFPSLVDLRFDVDKMPWMLDVEMIPASVKRLKIITTELFDLHGEWNQLRELDSLILETNFARSLNEVAEILEKIKTKVVVISWNGEGTLNTSNIIIFVLRVNQNVEKIIIGTIGDEVDLHKGNSPFDQTFFSNFVDQKKANHYLFENGKGTPLTYAEFEEWRRMEDAFDDCNRYTHTIAAEYI